MLPSRRRGKEADMGETTTPTRSKRTVASKVRALLAEEGYRPRPASDEDDPSTIYFKVEGNTFVIRCIEADPDFLAICTGYKLDDASKDELTLLRAAIDVQSDMKVAKVYLPRDLGFVEFQAELFLDGRPLSAALLERCIGTLRATCREFFKCVTPEEKPQASA
jgi:hypothetical protein